MDQQQLFLVKPSHEEIKFRIDLIREVLLKSHDPKARKPAVISRHFANYLENECEKSGRSHWKPMPRNFGAHLKSIPLFEQLRKRYQEIYRSQFYRIETRFCSKVFNSDVDHPSGGAWFPFVDEREKFDRLCLQEEFSLHPDKYDRLKDLYNSMKEYLDRYFYVAFFIEVDSELRKRKDIAEKERMEKNLPEIQSVEELILKFQLPDLEEFKVNLEERHPIVNLSPTLSFDISKQDFLCTYHEDRVLRKNVWVMSIQDQIDKRAQILKEFRETEWGGAYARPQNVHEFHNVVRIIKPSHAGQIEADKYQKSLREIGWKIWALFGPQFLTNKNSEYAHYQDTWEKKCLDLEWRQTQEDIPVDQYLTELVQEYKAMNDFISSYLDKMLEEKIELEFQRWQVAMKDTLVTVEDEDLPPGHVFVVSEEEISIGIFTTAWRLREFMMKECSLDPETSSWTQGRLALESRESQIFGLKHNSKPMFGDLISDEFAQDHSMGETEENYEQSPGSVASESDDSDAIVPIPEQALKIPLPASSKEENRNRLTEEQYQLLVAVHYGPEGIPDRQNSDIGAAKRKKSNKRGVPGVLDDKKTSKRPKLDATTVQSDQQGDAALGRSDESGWRFEKSASFPIMAPEVDDENGSNLPPNRISTIECGDFGGSNLGGETDNSLSDVESRLDPVVNDEMIQSVPAALSHAAPVKRKRGRPRKNRQETQASQTDPSQDPPSQFRSRPDNLQEVTLYRVPKTLQNERAKGPVPFGPFSASPAPLTSSHPSGLPSGFSNAVSEPGQHQPITIVRPIIRVPRPPIGPRPAVVNAWQQSLPSRRESSASLAPHASSIRAVMPANRANGQINIRQSLSSNGLARTRTSAQRVEQLFERTGLRPGDPMPIPGCESRDDPSAQQSQRRVYYQGVDNRALPSQEVQNMDLSTMPSASMNGVQNGSHTIPQRSSNQEIGMNDLPLHYHLGIPSPFSRKQKLSGAAAGTTAIPKQDSRQMADHTSHTASAQSIFTTGTMPAGLSGTHTGPTDNLSRHTEGVVHGRSQVPRSSNMINGSSSPATGAIAQAQQILNHGSKRCRGSYEVSARTQHQEINQPSQCQVPPGPQPEQSMDQFPNQQIPPWALLTQTTGPDCQPSMQHESRSTSFQYPPHGFSIPSQPASGQSMMQQSSAPGDLQISDSAFYEAPGNGCLRPQGFHMQGNGEPMIHQISLPGYSSMHQEMLCRQSVNGYGRSQNVASTGRSYLYKPGSGSLTAAQDTGNPALAYGFPSAYISPAPNNGTRMTAHNSIDENFRQRKHFHPPYVDSGHLSPRNLTGADAAQPVKRQTSSSGNIRENRTSKISHGVSEPQGLQSVNQRNLVHQQETLRQPTGIGQSHTTSSFASQQGPTGSGSGPGGAQPKGRRRSFSGTKPTAQHQDVMNRLFARGNAARSNAELRSLSTRNQDSDGQQQLQNMSQPTKVTTGDAQMIGRLMQSMAASKNLTQHQDGSYPRLSSIGDTSMLDMPQQHPAYAGTMNTGVNDDRHNIFNNNLQINLTVTPANLELPPNPSPQVQQNELPQQYLTIQPQQSFEQISLLGQQQPPQILRPQVPIPSNSPATLAGLATQANFLTNGDANSHGQAVLNDNQQLYMDDLLDFSQFADN